MSYLHFKRAADFLAAFILLLLLLPLLVLIALAIRLESRGPIFYASKRIGRGFQVFDFYKFRSMRINADAMLANMDIKNQYAGAASLKMAESGVLLFADGGWIDESQHIQALEEKEAAAFVKIPNDPRVTKVGSFLRNTSLDELPQLLNVLFGDMSLVGNRPLPMYEAAQLTTDEGVARFVAPAGITGLWQVTERGTSATTTSRRKELDNEYAEKISFWLDLQILIKTPMAAFQREKV